MILFGPFGICCLTSVYYLIQTVAKRMYYILFIDFFY